MTFLWNLFAFVIAIGIIVPIHEFGHFIVARWCGVRVLRFSVGFGRPLARWQKRPESTEWVLSAIPLGGYVKMLDEREAPVPPEQLGESFNRKSVYRRIAIVAAGPIANLLLAIVIYWALLIHGIVEPRAILGMPAPGTPAAHAGFTEAEQVVAVDGKPVSSWVDLRWSLLKAAADHGSPTLSVVDGSGRKHERVLDTSVVHFDSDASDPTQQLGISLYRPAVIGDVASGGAAERSGMKKGDRILAVDGKFVGDWSDLAGAIAASPERELAFSVQRGSDRLELHVKPEAVEDKGKRIGRIGVMSGDLPGWREQMTVEVRHGPVQAVALAANRTWETIGLSLRMMGRMLTGEVSARNLSGPLTIADYAGRTARMGIEPYLEYLALISISIGILNLLPVPLLDGGHIMYYLAEILMRRPVSEHAMEIGQRVGFAVLAMLMAFAFFNDVSRLLS